MKTIVNKYQVSHLFAHQAQSYASTSSRNFYFNDNVCNSYGSHFVAAVHHGDVVLLNSHAYSVTTASHLSALRSACSHLVVIYVPAPGATQRETHIENFDYLVAEYEKEVLRLSRARTYKNPEYAHRVERDANAYAKRFKLRRRIKAIPLDDIKPVLLAREQAKQKANQAKQRKQITAWRNGTFYGRLHNLPVMCRLSSDKRTLQTSLGAEVPVEHVKKWISSVLTMLKDKTTWTRNGHEMRLGHFQIDKVDGVKGTLLAGCHTITHKEIRHIATLVAP